MASDANILPWPHRVARWLSSRGVRGGYFWWRIACFVEGLPQAGLFELPGGVPFAFDPDDWMARGAYQGLYERAEIDVIRRLLRPGETAVDVGGNIGYLAAIAGITVGSEGRILVLEPSDRCREALESVTEWFGDGRIEKIAVAAGARRGRSMMHDHDVSGNSGLGTLASGRKPIEANSSEVEVRVVPLSALLKERGIVRCDLVKIDVEGYEGDVLAGFTEFLDRSHLGAVILEVTRSFGTSGIAIDVVRKLETNGFHAYRIAESGLIKRRPTLIPIDAREIGAISYQFNLLIVRDDRVSRVESLIKSNSS